MSFNLQSLLTATASDDLMVKSTASYLDARAQKAGSCLEFLQDILSEGKTAAELPDSLNVNLPIVSLDGNMGLCEMSDLSYALEQDNDEFVSNGVYFNADSCVEQITKSTAAAYATAEAMNSLGEGNNEGGLTSIIANYNSRLNLKFSGMTPTAASYGYAYLSTLSDPSMPVKDKVLAMLQIFGVSDNKTKSDITPPANDFNDITGANVWTAWGAEVVSTTVFGTIAKAATNIWNGIGRIADSVLGPIWDKGKELAQVYVGTKDSYKSSDKGKFNGFSDYGTTIKVDDVTNEVEHDLSNILSAMGYYYCIIKDTTVVPELDIIALAEATFTTATIDTVTDYVDLIWGRYDAVNKGYTRSDSILDDLQVLEDMAFAREYPNAAFFEKLTTSNYLTFEFPSCDIYAWKDSNGDVLMTFYWIPVDMNSFGWDETSAYSDLKTADAWMEVLSNYRINGPAQPSNDAGMYQAILNSRMMFAAYLRYIHYTVNGETLPIDATFNAQCNNVFEMLFEDDLFSAIPSPISNANLAHLLVGSTDGNIVTSSNSYNTAAWAAFESSFLAAFMIISSDEYYAAYMRTNAVPTSKFTVLMDSTLANYVTNAFIAVAAIAVAVAAFTVISRLAAKAYAMKASADAKAWDLAIKGTGTSEDFTALYRKSRKAGRLANIGAILTGSASTASSMSSSVIQATNAAGLTSFGNSIKGGKSIMDVYTVIR